MGVVASRGVRSSSPRDSALRPTSHSMESMMGVKVLKVLMVLMVCAALAFGSIILALMGVDVSWWPTPD